MQRKNHDGSEGARLWMNSSELDKLYGVYAGGEGALDDDMEKEYALRLMGECGLRTAEMLDVTPSDVRTVETDEGELTKLRVRNGKNEKDRETVVPDDLAHDLNNYVRYYAIADDAPYIDRSRRTIQRWMASAGEHMASQTGDDDWTEVTAHDLRRSWAMGLLDGGASATVVMELGGWENYRTFKEHYLGHHSDATIAREVASVT